MRGRFGSNPSRCTAPDQDRVSETSPPDRVAIGVTCVDVKVRIVDTVIRVVNIDRLGRDVQIAEPNGRLRWIEALAEIPADEMKPFQLVGIRISADFVSLRNVPHFSGMNDLSVFAL
jgi:hypothetical protein